MPDLIPRVTILAVGVSHYLDPALKTLSGPEHDLEKLKKLLVENKDTALYKPERFFELFDPSSSDLRKFISDYVVGRSADGDILVFYFSGHGVPIGRDDFGFCTTDTIIHSRTGVTLPLSVVKFRELLNSIHIANIVPVIIIDACYSGMAGKSLIIPAIETITGMEHQVHSLEASRYALLCSCADDQVSTDTASGGIFSCHLVDLAIRGLPLSEANKPDLTLKDIFPKLSEIVLSDTGNTVPRLYLGSTLPDFPLVRNSQYVSKRLSFSPTYLSILNALWNNGQERDLSPDEIGKLCSKSAYCNHNKLSFAPWDLVETVPESRRRRLTERGRQFVLGKLDVPKMVVINPQTKEATPAENTKYVKYKDLVI
jgi:hypothetical protein